MYDISGDRKNLLIYRQLFHSFYSNVKPGIQITKGLNVDVDAVMSELKHESVTA